MTAKPQIDTDRLKLAETATLLTGKHEENGDCHACVMEMIGRHGKPVPGCDCDACGLAREQLRSHK